MTLIGMGNSRDKDDDSETESESEQTRKKSRTAIIINDDVTFLGSNVPPAKRGDSNIAKPIGDRYQPIHIDKKNNTNKTKFPTLNFITSRTIRFPASKSKTSTIKSSNNNNNNNKNNNNNRNNYNTYNSNELSFPKIKSESSIASFNNYIIEDSDEDNLSLPKRKSKSLPNINYNNNNNDNQDKEIILPENINIHDKIINYKRYNEISTLVNIEYEKIIPILTNSKLKDFIPMGIQLPLPSKLGRLYVPDFILDPPPRLKEIIDTRQKRAITENIILVGKWPLNLENCSQIFCVKGNTNQKYQVSIDHTFSCSCMDWSSAQSCGYCKHIAFILINVLGVPAGSPYSYQRQSTKAERFHLLVKPNPNLFKKLNRRLSEDPNFKEFQQIPLPPIHSNDDGFELINDIDNEPSLVISNKRAKKSKSTSSLPTNIVSLPISKGYFKRRANSDITPFSS